MFINYLKVAIRNLWRSKLYAIINIFGLSVAIGCCIVAYLDFQYSDDFDAFHANARSIYRVESIQTINGKQGNWGTVPLPLGRALRKDFPAIDRMTRFSDNEAVVRSGDEVFNEIVRYADESFFEMFTFPMLLGSKDVLKDRSNAVLSENYAHKYFADDNPLGKQLKIIYRNGQEQVVTVAAVAKKIPGNSSIKFDILLSCEKLVEAHIDDPGNWAHWTSATFVLMRDPEQVEIVRSGVGRYVAEQNLANPKHPISGLYFEPLLEIAVTSRSLHGNFLSNSVPPSAVAGPIVVAILLLLMACFNYVNTSIAFSFNRMKEIGVRKVIGANRSQLIRQFLGENLVVCSLSMLVALGIAELLVPGFRRLFPFVEIQLDYTQNVRLILFLGGLLLTTALLAGAYPAYYITTYRPVALLRGQQKIGRSTILMRFLLAAQFALSMVAVGTGIVFSENARYQEAFDVGYKTDRLVSVPIANESQYTIYRNALEGNESVESIAGSTNQVFFGFTQRVVQSEGKTRETEALHVGFDYMETMGFRLKKGRLFDRKQPSDEMHAAIVTEQMVQEFGWDEPLGKTIELDSAQCTIIGVVKDFYSDGVWRPIAPVVFKMAKPATFRFVVARLSRMQPQTAIQFLKRTWTRLFPDAPYDGFFQDTAMEQGISVSHSITVLFAVIGSLALVISVMGLFALVSLGIARRTKEIGIRKVLGASVSSLLQLLNREFISILIASALVSDVIGYIAAKSLMDSIYEYHINVSIIALVIANMTVLISGIMTAGFQTMRVTRSNPVDALRYE